MAKPKLKMLTPGTELYPIRAVSALTGVNSITLRAWERRHGLIKPVRTPKGHRLYTREDIDLIHKVTALLDKGVAIGQVRAALGLRRRRTRPSPATDQWTDYRATMISAISGSTRTVQARAGRCPGAFARSIPNPACSLSSCRNWSRLRRFRCSSAARFPPRITMTFVPAPNPSAPTSSRASSASAKFSR